MQCISFFRAIRTAETHVSADRLVNETRTAVLPLRPAAAGEIVLERKPYFAVGTDVAFYIFGVGLPVDGRPAVG